MSAPTTTKVAASGAAGQPRELVADWIIEGVRRLEGQQDFIWLATPDLAERLDLPEAWHSRSREWQAVTALLLRRGWTRQNRPRWKPEPGQSTCRGGWRLPGAPSRKRAGR